jgi:hypothetical protein
MVENDSDFYADPTGPDERPDYRQRRDLGETEQVPMFIDGRAAARISVSQLLSEIVDYRTFSNTLRQRSGRAENARS